MLSAFSMGEIRPFLKRPAPAVPEEDNTISPRWFLINPPIQDWPGLRLELQFIANLYHPLYLSVELHGCVL